MKKATGANAAPPAHATSPAGSSGGSPSGGRPRSVSLDAPAKVNLFLTVHEREATGYHRIRTVFQSLELADRLEVERTEAPGVTLDVSGLDAGPPQENLARRAAAAFLDAARAGAGVHIRLLKRIPAGGGLGGGSSDAAATLTALELLLPDGVPRPRLLELAAALGSDVPFFLCGSPLAFAEGRGERLTPLPPLPAADVILALPDVAVRTAWAYGALDRRVAATAHPTTLPDPPPTLRDWDSVARLGVNDFEEVVLEAHPLVAAARNALRKTGPRMVLLSGSGSSVFAIYPDRGSAERALADLDCGEGVRYVITRTRTSVTEPVQAGAPE